MNKKMITVIALLLAVVITGYSVSGTYAKYATQLSATSDQARVARWDFKIGKNSPGSSTEVDLDLFNSSYACTTSEGANCVQELTKSVSASLGANDSSTNVIAPGTSGEAAIQLSIDTETAFTLKFSLADVTNGNKVKLTAEEVDEALSSLGDSKDSMKTQLSSKNVIDLEKGYSPIKFTIKLESSSPGNQANAAFEYSEFATALNAMIKQMAESDSVFKKNYFLLDKSQQAIKDSNQNYVFKPVSKHQSVKPIIVGWEWKYEYTGSEAEIKKAVNLLDTALAKKAEEKTINFKVLIDAEQYSETKAA